MQDYMLLFHGQAPTGQPSPEQLQAIIAQWKAWIGSIAAQGKFVSTNQLMPFGKLIRNGGKLVTDGPYTEGKEIIGGYLILKAASIDEAVELAKGCPALQDGSTVEVREVPPLPA